VVGDTQQVAELAQLVLEQGFGVGQRGCPGSR
jgi:hypothetical protein